MHLVEINEMLLLLGLVPVRGKILFKYSKTIISKMSYMLSIITTSYVFNYNAQGGASVGYHAVNQESRKYFHRAFPMSGTPLSYFAELTSNNHTDLVIDIAKRNGRSITNQLELVDYLKNVSSEEIFAGGPQIIPNERTLNMPWAPIVEGLLFLIIEKYKARGREAFRNTFYACSSCVSLWWSLLILWKIAFLGSYTANPFVTKDLREAYENDNIDIPTIYSHTSLVSGLNFLINSVGFDSQKSIFYYFSRKSSVVQGTCTAISFHVTSSSKIPNIFQFL